MDSQPQYAGAQILQGWIDLTSGRDSAVKRSVTYFDKALVGNKKEIEVIKYKYFIVISNQGTIGQSQVFRI